MCIHSHEGSWTDSGAPYWGGMQMDLSFQAAYGRWMFHHIGTANHWPRSGQLYASYKAWLVRGWTPWPQTSLMCGLL